MTTRIPKGPHHNNKPTPRKPLIDWRPVKTLIKFASKIPINAYNLISLTVRICFNALAFILRLPVHLYRILIAIMVGASTIDPIVDLFQLVIDLHEISDLFVA